MVAAFALAVMLAAAPTAKDLAKQEFTKAKKAYDVGAFSEALASYSEAYRLDPKPAFLFNIAQCHRQLANYDQAAFFLKRYLSYYPQGKAPNEKTVRELLTEMETKAADAEKKKEADAEAQRQKDLELARLAAAANKPPEPSVLVVPAAPPPATEVTPFPTSTTAQSEANAGTAAKSESITGKWWFWTGVGVVAAGAGTGAYFALRPQPRGTTLQTGDLR